MAFESSNRLKKDYYIYFLYDKNNIVRYIGRGRNRRYKDYTNRSEEYRKIVDEGGQSEVILDSLTKSESISIESKYLNCFIGILGEGFNLINKVNYKEVRPLLTYKECSEVFCLDEQSPYLRYTQKSLTKPGKLVLQKKPRPYPTVKVNGIAVSAHRVIWVLNNKMDLPVDFVVDHIDSDNTNNHPSNLQALTQEQNVRKAKMKSDTGFIGVSLDIGISPRYVAVWTVDNIQYSKSFGIRKYGEEEAFKLACEYRVLMQEKFHGHA